MKKKPATTYVGPSSYRLPRTGSDDPNAMRAGRSVAVAALPGAAAIALWGRYRHAVAEFGSQPATRPDQRGRVKAMPTSWGRLSYRLVPGTEPGPALVLVHGWGRAADAVWWQLIERTQRTVLAIDLPGHGRSLLERKRFTFDLAAEAVIAAIDDARLVRPILVGHSMGGPVCLTTVRHRGRHAFGGFVAIATSAFWVRTRQQLVVAAAPYLLAQSSPILLGAQRAEVKRDPTHANRIAWEYSLRPSRGVLEESAAALRRFDARSWNDLTLPHAVWIVTTNDGVVAPSDQRASAGHFSIPTVSVRSDHSEFIKDPTAVIEIIEKAAGRWSRQLPIGIRPRANRRRPVSYTNLDESPYGLE